MSAKSTPEGLLEAVQSAVETAFEPEQMPFFEALVNQPSHSYAKADVEAAHRIIDAKAAALGLGLRRWPVPDGSHADHRIYETPAAATAGASALALVGHVDTVFPRRLNFLEFRREADRAHGPGVLDMKSGLSACLFALQAVKRAAPEAFARLAVRFIVVSDEEVGSYTSRPLYEALAPTLSAGLVFEAGRAEDRIVTRRKGSAIYRIAVTGVAAHAGLRHAQGVNAIHALARIIPRIEALTDYERGLTFNVGLIEGGTAKNTVPDHAECTIDCRFERIADSDWARGALEALVADPFEGPAPAGLRGAQFALSGAISRPPMELTEASDALRLQYEHFAGGAGLGVGAAPLQGGGSDANILASFGVPCVDGLGPFGRHFHRTDEWCDLGSLKARTVALAGFLTAWSYGDASVHGR